MTTARASTRRLRILGALLVLATALAPRAISLSRALTIDEALWIGRSDRFVSHVQHGRFAEAYETGHPGVTVMWIGGLAQKTLPRDASLRERYARSRFAMSLVDVALILAIAWMISSMAGGPAGFFAGMLLALDPFLIAHNRVLHLDGLLSLLMLASTLALFRAGPSRRWLVVSGVLGGLAALTKQPSVFLVPVVLVILKKNGQGVLRPFGIWAASAAVTAFALYPSLWVNPAGPLGLILGSAARGASDSHSVGFFLGHPDPEPGPLFYPVVFLWRTSVVTLPATVATFVWTLKRREDPHARFARTFLIVALGFMAMMTIGFKKGDRYILPSIVCVDVAVAIAASRFVRSRSRALGTVAVALALVAHGGPALAVHPYEEASYNWLAGGSFTAQKVITVGWGEGLDQAAEDLSKLPNAASTTVATTRITQFDDFYLGTTIRLEDSSEMKPGGRRPDLVLFYISSVQSGRFETVWRRYRDSVPVYELRVGGIPMIRVFHATA